MSTFQQLRDNFYQALDSMSEGWQKLHQMASGAMTRFTAKENSTAKEDNQAGNNVSIRNPGWAMLAAEVFDDDSKLVVRLETPGLAKEDIDIEVQDNYLIVRGDKKFQRERKEGIYHISERAYGSFERFIPLSAGVDSDKARATYNDGVLKVELPKTANAARKRIAVGVK